MKKTTIIGLILLFIAAISITSCAGGAKKCGGKRGIRTPMGVM